MSKSNFLILTALSFILLFYPVLTNQNNFLVAQSPEEKYKCFPFLSSIKTSGQYQVISGNGEITQSSHPKVLPLGFGRDFSISSGGYNPVKKQIMLVVKNRYISIFLKQPLADNKSVEFIARPCGSSSSFAPRMHRLITPGLFFQSEVLNVPCSFPRPQTLVCFSFQGTLIKKNKQIQGKFAAQSGFYLTDNHSFPELKPNNPYKGFAQGKFTLNLRPGRSGNFPEPGNPVQALW